MEEIIKKYVDNLTKDDIISFANKEKISLTNKEIDIIYETIKKDYYVICFGDPYLVFLKLKDELNINTYNKIIELYKKYKKFI